MRLTFHDGSARTLDFKKILVGPVFGPLRDLRKFRRARINKRFGCVEWPNGADLCPEALHRGYLPDLKEKLQPGRGESVAKKKCRTMFVIKVKSKKTGRWKKTGFFGCNLRSMRRAVELYKEDFGKTAKIVKA